MKKPILKTQKLYQCTCDEDGNILEQQLVEIKHFDEAGKATKIEGFQDGELSLLIKNEYENNNLIRVQQLDYIFETEQNFENKFDEKNRPTEQIEYFQGGGFSKTTFEYDEDGKIIRQQSEDDEGTIEHRVEHDYDKNGNVLETREFDAENLTNPWISKTYEYDENENVIKYTEAYRDQESTTREYTHDKNGNMLSVQVYYTKEGDLILEQKNKYDEEGLLVSQDMYHYKENMKREDIHSYNENGVRTQTETLINENFHSLIQEDFNQYGDGIQRKELQPVRGGYMQWTASATENEYWENSLPSTPQNEEEE